MSVAVSARVVERSLISKADGRETASIGGGVEEKVPPQIPGGASGWEGVESGVDCSAGGEWRACAVDSSRGLGMTVSEVEG